MSENVPREKSLAADGDVKAWVIADRLENREATEEVDIPYLSNVLLDSYYGMFQATF